MVFREVDVVVILDAETGADAISDRASHQIIRNVLDILLARFGRLFAGKGRADGILGSHRKDQG